MILITMFFQSLHFVDSFYKQTNITFADFQKKLVLYIIYHLTEPSNILETKIQISHSFYSITRVNSSLIASSNSLQISSYLILNSPALIGTKYDTLNVLLSLCKTSLK